MMRPSRTLNQFKCCFSSSGLTLSAGLLSSFSQWPDPHRGIDFVACLMSCSSMPKTLCSFLVLFISKSSLLKFWRALRTSCSSIPRTFCNFLDLWISISSGNDSLTVVWGILLTLKVSQLWPTASDSSVSITKTELQFHDAINLGEKITIIVDSMIPTVAEMNKSVGKKLAILNWRQRLDTSPTLRRHPLTVTVWHDRARG